MMSAKITLTQLLSGIAAIVSLFVGATLVLSNFADLTRNYRDRAQVDLVSATVNKQIAALDERIRLVNDEVKKIQQHIESLSTIPKEDALNIEIQNLKAATGEISAREAKIESAILESPSKALEIPLLKHDVDAIKESQQSSLAALKDSVDRIYDLNKWLLGAMAVSIVTLAVGNFVKSRGVKSADGDD
jgi:hypothetical protein